MIHKSQENTDR